MKAIGFQLLSIISTSIFLISTLQAGPRVIKDNRFKERGMTPVVGRGYSMATNTLQSTCFSKIKLTRPSYDFQYQFIDIDETWKEKFSSRNELSGSLKHLFISNNFTNTTIKEGEKTFYHHHIFVSLDLDSYYHSLDEGKTGLSGDAIQLLRNKDVVSFFNSCGPFYIRSIGRNSKFFAMLTYKTESTKRDERFDSKLKAHLRSLFKSKTNNNDTSSDFQKETYKKRLQISVWGYGLGKDHQADLLPTDIDSFKRIVKNSILAMQDSDVGMISSVEVVPWMENPEFQNELRLESTTDKIQFERKRNLEANSELIAEIDRIDSAFMNTYYKGLNCIRSLKEKFPLGTNEYEFDPEKTFILDLAEPSNKKKEIKLSTLLETVNDQNIEKIYEENQNFLFGDKKAVACVKELQKKGIDTTHYREVETCKRVRSQMVPIKPIFDHYCLPELARVIP